MNNANDTLRTRFDELCLAALRRDVEIDEAQDLAEMSEDLEAEFLEDTDDAPDEDSTDAIVGQPCDDTAVSLDEHGGVMSRYGDESWVLLDKEGRHVRLYFGSNREAYKINFEDPLASMYLQLQKMLIYSVLPLANPLRRPIASITVRAHHQQHLELLDWLYSNGFLLGHTIETVRPLSQLRLEDVRRELSLRMEQSRPVTDVTGLAATIHRLCNLTQKQYCPAQFKLSFTYKQVMDRKLARKLAAYIAQGQDRWRAIDFDDLELMLRSAKDCIDTFSDDVLWMLAQYAEVRRRQEEKGQNYRYVQFTDSADRADIFTAILNRQFAVNPTTGTAWWSVEVKEPGGDKARYIPVNPVRERMLSLAGACIFMLLFFTGMRSRELRGLKPSWLKINGKPLDTERDAVAQVANAGPSAKFDLLRLISKIDENQPGGRPHEVPVPFIAARAFAILVELFRAARKRTGTEWVLPPRRIRTIYFSDQDTPEDTPAHALATTHITCLRRFCEDLGIDLQSPHRCRKSLATLLINNDPASLDVIRFLLGHKSIVMTYQYVMCLPGINDELLAYVREKNLEKLGRLIGDGIEGKLAGAGGDRALDSIIKNLDAFKGRHLGTTIHVLMQSLEKSDLSIIRTPAAWCLRHHGRVPRSAPCLPEALQAAIASGEILDGAEIHPQPEHCVPWKCGDATHTTMDISNARRNQRYAAGKATSAKTASARSQYREQEEYWESVVERLENGRSDFAGLGLLEAFVAEGGNGF